MHDDPLSFGLPQWSRRELLQRSGFGLGAIAFNGLMQQLAASENSPNPLLPKAPHFPAKAKHLIHIFANGGPSHIDTWDPKPKIAEYEGKDLQKKLQDLEREGFNFEVNHELTMKKIIEACYANPSRKKIKPNTPGLLYYLMREDWNPDALLSKINEIAPRAVINFERAKLKLHDTSRLNSEVNALRWLSDLK